MGGRRNEKKRKQEGIQGERRKGKKKSLLLALNRQVSSAGCPVCGTGGGGWKDWFHFFPFLSHTLRSGSDFSPVPRGPSVPH